jgi:hypothetical protein
MEMNNLKNFEQFNEGFKEIKTWASKKLDPGDYGDTLLNILRNNIKPKFNPKYLKMGHTPGESKNKGYIYDDGTYNIEVIGGGGEFNNPPRMFLNGESVTRRVNKYIIMEYFNYFDEQYKINNE